MERMPVSADMSGVLEYIFGLQVVKCCFHSLEDVSQIVDVVQQSTNPRLGFSCTMFDLP
jgi:hypothetical protein